MLKGAHRRHDRAYELAMFEAWQTARLSRLEKLKPLADYLREVRPIKKQTPAQVLAALEAHRASGAPMKIRQVK